MTVMLACAFGGLGAIARFLVDGVVTRAQARAVARSVRDEATGVVIPLGTIVINVTASLSLGLVTGLVAATVVGHDVALVLGTGMLGGYSTFSTASVETFRLVQRGALWHALAHALGMLGASLLAGMLGLWLGTLL